MRVPLLLLILTMSAAPAAAQQGGPAVAAIRPHYDRLKTMYLRSAEAMPPEHYAFKPTPEVRSFGEILGHVANENFLFCAGAMVQKNPKEGTDFEKLTGKAELVAALRASFEFCDPDYRISDAQAMEEVTFFQEKGSRLWVLIYNVTHDSEHYGNIVTYLRLKGVTPPSSVGT